MTSRERMTAALGGRETDRTPFFPCMAVDYACTALGYPFEEALIDPRLGIRWMAGAGFHFGCDAVRVRATPPRSWFEDKRVLREGGELVQRDRRTGRLEGRFDVEGGGSLIPAEPPEPVRRLEQAEALGFTPAAELLANGSLETAAAMTAEAHARGVYVVGMAAGQTLNYMVAKVGDNAEALMLMATDPALTRALFAKATDASIEMIRALARIGVDGVYIGDSYASGSLISPAMYGDYCVPCYRRAAEAAQAEGLQVYKHCCGNYDPLLPLVGGNHLDGMEGMDPTSGMTVARTRAALGDLCLIGGVSCLSLLNNSPEEVYRESRDCIRAGGPTGRFVLGSACAVPRHTPPDNIRAMARAALDSLLAP